MVSIDATDMRVEFARDASIEPLVLPNLKAYVAGESLVGTVGRMKREFKGMLRMRIVDDRERLVSAKRVDVKVAKRALVAKTSSVDATPIAVEVSTIIDGSHQKGKRMRRVRGMGDYLLHLAA